MMQLQIFKYENEESVIKSFENNMVKTFRPYE